MSSFKIFCALNQFNISYSSVLKIQGEMEKTMDSFKLSSEADSFILMGTLQPFYQKLVNDFMKQVK